MRESDLQTKITRYARSMWKRGSVAIEVKITKGKSLPFKSVMDHQVAALLKAKHGSLVYKIADTGYDKKPFDMFILQGSLAFVAVQFYIRGCKTVYFIDIDVWTNEIAHSHRKSLTEDRAKEIAFVVQLAK